MSLDHRYTDAQKAAAIHRSRENIALQSGAGCGKTAVLTRRLTELLMNAPDPDDPLSGLVAVTFTDKAALEMVERIAEMLRGYAARSKGESRRKLLNWLQELPEARINTIHGFCATLLRSHAIEAGVDPSFSVAADDMLVSQLVADAAEQAVLAAAEREDEAVNAALAAVGFDRLVEQVRTLVDRRTTWQVEAYTDPDATLERWREMRDVQRQGAWERVRRDAALLARVRQVEQTICSDPQDKLEIYRGAQVQAAQAVLASPANWTPELFARLARKPGNAGSAKRWGGKDAMLALRAAMRAIVERLSPLSAYAEDFGPLDEQAAVLLAAATELADKANALYAGEKRRRGLLDFTDLLHLARRMLESNPSLRQTLREGIVQLLIDEAQDTDAFQIGLLELLAFGEAGIANPPPGRMFLVGDAKQSIYRFRGAQVDVFQDLCARLGPRQQELLDLSFRTHAAGVDFVNQLFSRLMGECYEPITAHRGKTPAAPSVEILLAAGSEAVPVENASSASIAQAALAAQRIEEMVAKKERLAWNADADDWRPVRYGDVAILFARMTDSLEYERQLAARHIPYYVLGGTGFFKQQEIYDLLNALRVIDNPYDDIAFVGVLRSSLFGLDDNALAALAERIRPPYLPALMAHSDEQLAEDLAPLGDEPRQAVRDATRLLTSLHRRKDAFGVEGVLRAVLDATAYEAVLLSQFQGTRMAGNVRLLRDRARMAEADGLGLAEFVQQVGEMTLSEVRHEQAAVAEEQANVVKLMTIHKAKGLEFPVVIIPDLNTGRQAGHGPLNHRQDWKWTCRIRDDSPDADAELPLSYRLAQAMEEEDSAAEDIRLLYVAATRHEDHLILLGADWRNQDGTFRPSNSRLAKIDAALGLRERLDQAEDRDESRHPYGDGFEARLARIVPDPPARRKRTQAPGEKMLAAAASPDALRREMLKTGDESRKPSLLGAIPLKDSQVEISATALGDFAHCPMLYRWRHELRLPQSMESGGGRRPAGQNLDAATVGTLYHLCMERLDVREPASPAALVHQAAAEMGLAEDAVDEGLIADFAAAMERFEAHPLAASLRDARRIDRELHFLLRTGRGILRGQIDLLYQDAGGDWRIVDYKSDRVDADGAAEHAKRYEVQMMAYALAAGQHLGRPPAGAMLYFLRPGRVQEFAQETPKTGAQTAQRPPSESTFSLATAEARVTELLDAVARSRRSGEYARRDDDGCSACPYGRLCEAFAT